MAIDTTASCAGHRLGVVIEFTMEDLEGYMSWVLVGGQRGELGHWENVLEAGGFGSHGEAEK